MENELPQKNWLHRFLDRYVKDTPSTWTVPFFVFIYGLIQYYSYRLADLYSMQVNEGGVGFRSLLGALTVSLLLCPIAGPFFYWVGGSFTHLFVRLVGGQGFVLTRRIVLYFGIVFGAVSCVINLYGVLVWPMMSLMTSFLVPAATLVCIVTFFVYLYKAYRYVMDMSVGQFILGLVVLPIVVFLLFVLIGVVCSVLMVGTFAVN